MFMFIVAPEKSTYYSNPCFKQALPKTCTLTYWFLRQQSETTSVKMTVSEQTFTALS